MSRAVLERKLDALAAADPDWIATGNPGCLMQLRAGLARARPARAARCTRSSCSTARTASAASAHDHGDQALSRGDRSEVVALWRRAFPDDPPHNEPNAVIDAKVAVDDLIFVAAEQNRIHGAAVAGYDGHRGWLYSVAVDAPSRRRGVGRALVTHAIGALRELGCIKVNLQVRASNASVVAFYESLGFALEDRMSLGMHIGSPAADAGNGS